MCPIARQCQIASLDCGGFLGTDDGSSANSVDSSYDSFLITAIYNRATSLQSRSGRCFVALLAGATIERLGSNSTVFKMKIDIFRKLLTFLRKWAVELSPVIIIIDRLDLFFRLNSTWWEGIDSDERLSVNDSLSLFCYHLFLRDDHVAQVLLALLYRIHSFSKHQEFAIKIALFKTAKVRRNFVASLSFTGSFRVKHRRSNAERWVKLYWTI